VVGRAVNTWTRRQLVVKRVRHPLLLSLFKWNGFSHPILLFSSTCAKASVILVSFWKLEGLGFKVQGLGFRGSVNTSNGPAYDCLWHVYLVVLEYFF
jgi:hypothetical protein